MSNRRVIKSFIRIEFLSPFILQANGWTLSPALGKLRLPARGLGPISVPHSLLWCLPVAEIPDSVALSQVSGHPETPRGKSQCLPVPASLVKGPSHCLLGLKQMGA